MPEPFLWRMHRKRIDIPLLILAALVLLYQGLTMPLVRFASLLRDDFGYSILGGIGKLFEAGDSMIAALILLMSVVFPLLKLGMLILLWVAPMAPAWRRRLLHILEPLGKWSMLDVLVVILFAGAVQLGLLADATILPGAYVYAGAILLSMLVAELTGRLVRPAAQTMPPPRSRSRILPLLAVSGLLLLVLGIILPLMRVEKWFFWQEHYSILAGALELARDGQAFLALGFAVFVIILPLLVQLAQLVLSFAQLTGKPGAHRLHWILTFNRWAMMDVFALALFIAALRLNSMTDLTPLIGLWFLIAGLLLSVMSSLWLHRILPAPD